MRKCHVVCAHMSNNIRTCTPHAHILLCYKWVIVVWFRHSNNIYLIMCFYNLTLNDCTVKMFRMATLSPMKRKILLASGTLNPHPESVKSDLFKMEFFDPHDRAQVKYEMLRCHEVEGEPIAEACRLFGFSRESFYQIQKAVREQGFPALLPAKKGRKGPTKLKGEILQFALQKSKENPALVPGRLAALIDQRYGVAIHRTTVLRGMKKKRHSPAQRFPRRRRRG